MLGIRYGHGSDNVAIAATLTASAPDAAYPASFLADGDPAHPAKLTTTSGYWQFDFGAAQRIDLVALIHHNFAPGLNVRVQAGADGTTFPFDAAITIPAYREDGFPVSPWRDLTTLPGYTTGGARYWRIAVVGANSTPCALGEVVLLKTIRTLDRHPQWGFVDSENHPLVEHVTDLGVVTIAEYGTLTRTYSGQIIASEAGAAELRAHARDVRFRARGWLFIPDAAVNEAWYVRFRDMPQLRTHTMTNANPMTFSVEEIARGLPL